MRRPWDFWSEKSSWWFAEAGRQRRANIRVVKRRMWVDLKER